MPIAWVSMIARKLAPERLRRIRGDDLDRFEQRQACLDAAHDDVDGVRQRFEEGLLPALFRKFRPQRGRPKPAAKASPAAPSNPRQRPARLKADAARMAETTQISGSTSRGRLASWRTLSASCFPCAGRLQILQRSPRPVRGASAESCRPAACGRSRLAPKRGVLGFLLFPTAWIDEDPCGAAIAVAARKASASACIFISAPSASDAGHCAPSSAAPSRFSSL